MKRVQAFKRAICVFMALIFLTGAAPVSASWQAREASALSPASSAPTSGVCGDNLTWEFDESTGTLTISGTGDMWDWDYNSHAPWLQDHGYGWVNNDILKVIIEEGVTSVGDYAFESCRGIGDVKFPSTLKSIGEMAFNHNYNLKEIAFPSGLESIGDYAFFASMNIEEINLPYGIKQIGTQAFRDGEKIRKIIIPETATDIGYAAFTGKTAGPIGSGCDIEFGWTTNIPDKAFGGDLGEGIPELVSVIIPEGMVSIGDWAFQGCQYLESVTLPDSLLQIGNGAFNTCDRLTHIDLPDKLQVIGSGAFFFSGLTSIAIPQSVLIVGNDAFSCCGNLAIVSLPKSLSEISNNLFSGCRSLKAATIPEKVDYVGEGAFSNCSSLKNVIFPDSVNLVCDNAFSNCNSLEKVYYSGSESSWGSISIGSGNEDLTESEIVFSKASTPDMSLGNGTDPAVTELYVVSRTPDKETVNRFDVFECEFNMPVRKPTSSEPDAYISIKDGYHVDPVFTLNTKSDLVRVEGSKVYFDLGQADLDEGTLYFIIFDAGSVYAQDGTPFYGLKYNLIDKKAWQFQVSSLDSDVTLKWDTTGHLWWKNEDRSKPPYPDGSDEEYAAAIVKWAQRAGIGNVTPTAAAAMLDEPAYLPVTDVNASTWLLNDGGTTVRQVVEDLIFLENLQPYINNLDGSLDDRGAAYEMIMDWNDQIQDYLKERNGNSNLFFSAAMPLAHEALTYLTSGIDGDIYKYTRPILKANIDTSIQNYSTSGLEAYDNYHDYKEAVSEIGDALSTGKKVYKAFAGDGASGWLKLGWDMFSEYYEGAGSDVIDDITSVLSYTNKIKGVMQIAMVVGNTTALFPLVIDFYNSAMKGIKDDIAGMYFVYYYYIYDKYTQIYNLLYDEEKDAPSDYNLPEVMANYAGLIMDDPILKSWVDYMSRTDADKYLHNECTQLRRDLANYALLLLYAKSINVGEAQKSLARYLSAELSDSDTMRDILIGSCPVRIDIYDVNTNVKVASLSSEDQAIMDCEYGTLYLMCENNETKCFVLYSGEYRAQIIPYDNGTMDVLVTEVGENGEMSSVYFEDVNLVNGEPLNLSSLKSNASLETGGQAISPNPLVPVSSILLTAPAELAVGESAAIGTEISPVTATDYELTWASSNPSVAEVSDGGTVTAKSAGSTKITATSANGVSSNVEVQVYTPAESISLDVDSLNICVGEELPVSITVSPLNATHPVKWSSSSGSVAIVDDSGNICALSEGTAVLTAEVDGVSDSVTVTVAEKPISVILYQSDTNGDRIKVDIINGSLYSSYTGSVFVSLYDTNGRMLSISEQPLALGPGTYMTDYIPISNWDGYSELTAKAFTIDGQMLPVALGAEMNIIG